MTRNLLPARQRSIARIHRSPSIPRWILPALTTLTMGLTVTGGLYYSQLVPSLMVTACELMIAMSAWQTARMRAESQQLRRDFVAGAQDLRHEFRRLTRMTRILKAMNRLHDPQAVDLINSFFRDLAGFRSGSIFFKVAIQEFRRAADSVRNMSAGKDFNKFFVPTQRDLLTSLIVYINALDTGDTWDTVSNTDLWSKRQLEMPTEFLLANRRAAQTGAVIRRIFLLPADLVSLGDDAREMLETYASDPPKHGMETRCLLSSKYQEDLEQIGNFAVWQYQRTKERLLLRVEWNRQGSAPLIKHFNVSRDEQALDTHAFQFEELWTGDACRPIADVVAQFRALASMQSMGGSR